MLTNANQKHAVLKATIKAFIPYSEENLLLARRPNQFFNYIEKLEQQTGANKNTIRATISRAKRSGLIKVDEKGRLVTTWRGKIKVPLMPKKKLRHYLVVVFDIPEKYRRQRDLLRAYLKSTYAEQVQKSVWKTKYDIYDELLEVIDELAINDYVDLFMADEIL